MSFSEIIFADNYCNYLDIFEVVYRPKPRFHCIMHQKSRSWKLILRLLSNAEVPFASHTTNGPYQDY